MTDNIPTHQQDRAWAAEPSARAARAASSFDGLSAGGPVSFPEPLPDANERELRIVLHQYYGLSWGSQPSFVWQVGCAAAHDLPPPLALALEWPTIRRHSAFLNECGSLLPTGWAVSTISLSGRLASDPEALGGWADWRAAEMQAETNT